MRKLIFILTFFLLGINGVLLWQNTKDDAEPEHTCCAFAGKMNILADDVRTSLMPAILGLIQ
jgi:hypothetical protein